MYDVMEKYKITNFYNHLAAGCFYYLSYPVKVSRNVFSCKQLGGIHFHDYVQIWYCHSGEYTHITRTGKHKCCEGSIVIIPPGCPDDFEVIDGKNATLSSINIDLSIFTNTSFSQAPNTISNLFLPNFADSLKYNFADFAIISNEDKLIVETLIETINAVCSSDEECNFLPLSILNLLESLFSCESFHLPAEYYRKASELSETKVFPIIRALVYINKNFSRKLTASECAKVALICERSFFKTFRTFTGASFSEYLKQLRIVHATILLGLSPYSFTHIANLCGYSDAAYMANCIKKYTSRIPKERKRRMQEYYRQSRTEKEWHKSIEQIIETYME